MIKNGFISGLVSNGGAGIVNGLPASFATNEEYSKPIPCHIKTNMHDNLGTSENGTFIRAKYEILVEGYIFEATEKVKLEYADYRGEIGVYSVQDIQILSMVGRVKIIVT